MDISPAARSGRPGTNWRYEINISSATLSRPIEETCATLLHEMCHCLAAEKGVKRYQRFRELLPQSEV